MSHKGMASVKLRKRDGTEIERGRTRSLSVENWLWKRLWTCRKRDYGMNETIIDTRNLCMTTGVRLAS